MSYFQQDILSALRTSLEAQNALLKPNARLDYAVSNSNANNIPPIAISPSQGAMLSILCRLVGAKNILEIGTLGGYSTIWFAESVPGVQVTSIEFNPRHRDVATANTKGQGLSNVEIRLGAALDVLPQLAEEGKVFDFVFIDADWDEQNQYFDWAVKLTRQGGGIYVDNAVRKLTVNSEGNPLAQALINHVKTDERVDATLIPTLNTHKREEHDLVDGFMLAIVK